MIDKNDIKILSSTLDFWDRLSPEQQERLVYASNPVRYQKGETIFCNGRECVGVLIIKSGNVRIYITSEEGREITLYRLYGGDICILSASCVLPAIDFDVTVAVEEDCDAIQLCSDTLARLSSENVYVELSSYKLATQRFSDVMWSMQQILFISFDKRLAAFLCEECAKTGEASVNMTHEQIARYLGTAREVVSRMLKYFAEEGLVALSRGVITVKDISGLRRIM